MKLDDASPFTVLVPQTPREPVVIYNNQAALRMALVEKESLLLLDADWDVPGLYLLLYPRAADATFDLYVGKASTGGLKSRLPAHVKGKESWVRALLVVRDTTHGFNSAEVGWLEGRLWSLANAGANVRLVNGNQPKDETLPAFQRAALELAVAPISQVLRLLGYSLAPEDDITSIKAPGTKTYHGVTLLDLINAGLLSSGDVLEFSWSGFEGAFATVGPDGRLTVGDKTYGSPSGAGQAVRGGIVNGWEYWGKRDANKNFISLAELRARLPPKVVPSGG